jgi:hypothetical protein
MGGGLSAEQISNLKKKRVAVIENRYTCFEQASELLFAELSKWVTVIARLDYSRGTGFSLFDSSGTNEEADQIIKQCDHLIFTHWLVDSSKQAIFIEADGPMPFAVDVLLNILSGATSSSKTPMDPKFLVGIFLSKDFGYDYDPIISKYTLDDPFRGGRYTLLKECPDFTLSEFYVPYTYFFSPKIHTNKLAEHLAKVML